MSLLLRRVRGADGERGSALVAVIGIAAVFAIISVTLVGTSVFAAATSGATRAGVQVQAATEQGIDVTLANLNATALRGSESSFPCQLNHSFSTPTGTVDVAVDVTYRSTGSSVYQCPAPAGLELTGAVFTARGSSTVMAGNGATEVKKVVQQELQLLPVGSVGPLFGYGVFSAGDLETTNNFEIIDGGAHTNGKFRCNSAAQILGPVSAVDDASITNTCTMNELWSGGEISCSSNPIVFGDVIAAGTGTSSFTNTCEIHGDLTAGGKITTGGWTVRGGSTYSVGGNITSSTGPIAFDSGVRVAGNAQAGGSITSGAGTPLSTIVAGSRTANTVSPVPTAPAVVAMPAITWADLTPPSSPAPLDYKVWLQQNAQANGAPTWSDAYEGTSCDAIKDNYSLNGGLISPAAPTVVDARGCTTAHFQDLDLTLRNDLTLVVNNFTSSNGLRVTSVKPGPDDAKLRIIVPTASGATPCAPTVSREITFNSGGVVFAPNVDVLLYTGGKVTLTNGVDLHGSVYGCLTNFSVDSTITYSDVTPPGMNPPPNPLYEFTPSARFDLAANA